jgi:hypothetical protein
VSNGIESTDIAVTAGNALLRNDVSWQPNVWVYNDKQFNGRRMLPIHVHMLGLSLCLFLIIQYSGCVHAPVQPHCRKAVFILRSSLQDLPLFKVVRHFQHVLVHDDDAAQPVRDPDRAPPLACGRRHGSEVHVWAEEVPEAEAGAGKK